MRYQESQRSGAFLTSVDADALTVASREGPARIGMQAGQFMRDGEGNLVLAGDGGRVVKTNPAAQLLWEQSFSGLTARGVAVDAAGYVYVVGSVDGQGADLALRKLAP